jgi:hypothetical protein
MRKTIFAAVPVILFLQGCAPATPSYARTEPGWSVYSNDTYGYEIQYPEGFDRWPTGPEGQRDGASIRIAVKDRQSPVPVLDIRISPRTSEEEFTAASGKSVDFKIQPGAVSISGAPAKERIRFWKSNGEIAFVEIYLDGVVFQFAAASGLTDFHASEWWKIISTFRFLRK